MDEKPTTKSTIYSKLKLKAQALSTTIGRLRSATHTLSFLFVRNKQLVLSWQPKNVILLLPCALSLVGVVLADDVSSEGGTERFRGIFKYLCARIILRCALYFLSDVYFPEKRDFIRFSLPLSLVIFFLFTLL